MTGVLFFIYVPTIKYEHFLLKGKHFHSVDDRINKIQIRFKNKKINPRILSISNNLSEYNSTSNQTKTEQKLENAQTQMINSSFEQQKYVSHIDMKTVRKFFQFIRD